MCGIVGQTFQRGQCKPEILRAMRDTMIHRGPDDAGEWTSPDFRVGLAHRRLAIIDLSSTGHQPMQDQTGKLTIVFNGEIYNFRELRKHLAAKGHKFRSNSDTEVILAAYREWGTDCLNKLNGMFAFGLYDDERKRLFLARDRAGEKPLFYWHHEGTLSFASELKALMANPDMPRRLDMAALDCYLAFGYVPGDLCILKSVNKLPPAHALTYHITNGQLKIWRYWQLPEAPETTDQVNKQKALALVEELESLIQDAVRRQLIADVPVGILLSGGVDSSLTTAMAVRFASNVKTFTVRFPGYGKYDETEHARLIASHFGTEHIELKADALTVDLLPLLAKQFDEPMIDSSMIPTYMVSKLVRQHCTVALGGDGGDELFGGYVHYGRFLWSEKIFGCMPLQFRRVLSGVVSKLTPIGLKGRNWFQTMGTDFKRQVPSAQILFNLLDRRWLLKTNFTNRLASFQPAESLKEQLTPLGDDMVQRATRNDFLAYLPEDILVKVDRSSMLNSLEVRAPWLDYRIIEFAFGKIPSVFKSLISERKILPKMLARQLLPLTFDLQRKQGFSIPINHWLRKKEWLNLFTETLLGSKDGLFDRNSLNSLLRGQARGLYNGERLFGLLMFELWRQNYRVVI